MDSRQLSIPIYLNQRIVFDLLAIVEDGFTQLRNVRTSEVEGKGTRTESAGEIGLSNVFAFLGLQLKRKSSKTLTEDSQREIQEERVYTPTSLFSRLREVLVENKLLKQLDNHFDITTVEVGSFIEFSAILNKNPLIDTMDAMIRVMETAVIFTGPGDTTPQHKKGGQHKVSSEKRVLDEMFKFRDKLTQENTLDLVAFLTNIPLYKAVIPVEIEYFSSKSPATLIDGQFIVLGKVIRHIPDASPESISLLRGTSLAHAPDEVISQFKNAFLGLQVSGFKMPEFQTKLESPVLLVVPIAIYI